jgi:hypothetical protein
MEFNMSLNNPKGRNQYSKLPPTPPPDSPSPDAPPKSDRINGKFAPGNRAGAKGRPVGSRHKSSLIAEQLFDDRCELLVEKCVSMALAGDPTAMRIAISRLIPERKSRPVSIANMPKIERSSDLVRAAGAITDAASAGEITVDEAAALSALVANFAKAAEVCELAERLAKLEEQFAAKG